MESREPVHIWKKRSHWQHCHYINDVEDELSGGKVWAQLCLDFNFLFTNTAVASKKIICEERVKMQIFTRTKKRIPGTIDGKTCNGQNQGDFFKKQMASLPIENNTCFSVKMKCCFI